MSTHDIAHTVHQAERARQAFEQYYGEALPFLREINVQYQVLGVPEAGGAVLFSRWGNQLRLPLCASGQVQNTAGELLTVAHGQWLNSNSLVVLIGDQYARWRQRRSRWLKVLAAAWLVAIAVLLAVAGAGGWHLASFLSRP